MQRRDFLAAIGASIFPVTVTRRLEGNSATTSAFPVHFRRANPYEPLLRFINPGKDEFNGEQAAVEIEERLRRIFSGKEEFPASLKAWSGRIRNVQSAAFYSLPGDLVRYEIRLSGPVGLSYYTGLWSVPDFEVVEEEVTSSSNPLFRDATAHVFGRTESFSEQLLKGNPFWRARLDAATGIDVYGNQGIAVGDIDNDGADEVYVCQGGGLPNRLYRFRPDGTAADITDQAGVGVLDETTCALFIDLKNSGHQDLIVLRSSGPLLFLNRGDGTFREHPDAFRFKTKPQGSFTGMAAADYDRDGRLDLYLCCYVYFQSEDQYQFPAPYQDARNGPPNFLLKNRLTTDGGVFEDVTEESGLNENNDRFSFAPAWCDFDGDGWPDLYVANDFGRNNLYRNRGGRFRDEAAKAGVEDIGPGMSAYWFDYDGDGRPDLYVSNMWSAAGQRVTRNPAFKAGVGLADAYRRHTKGNSLYRNQGDGTFLETGPSERVEMGRWAWSSGAFDFDFDGSPEIYITAGMLTNASSTDLNSFFWRQVVAKSPPAQRPSPDYENGWSAINQLIRQDYSWCGHERNVLYVRRNGRYEDCSGISGIDFADDSRSFAVTDFDGDGNLDILLKSRLGPQVRALQNHCAAGKPAVAISLQGTKSNRDAIGARVEINGRAQWIQAGSGFLSQHTKSLHFGLQGQSRASGRILWPSGLTQEIADLEPGFRYKVVEGSGEFTRAPFRSRHSYPSAPVVPINTPEAADVWFVQPVPTPKKQHGPGFLLLYAGRRPDAPGSLNVEAIDLALEPDEVAAGFSLLRRYLFEYRTELQLPLALLLDADSRVRSFIRPCLPNKRCVRISRGSTRAGTTRCLSRGATIRIRSGIISNWARHFIGPAIPCSRCLTWKKRCVTNLITGKPCWQSGELSRNPAGSQKRWKDIGRSCPCVQIIPRCW